jgi:putative sigma-54 modulation protein
MKITYSGKTKDFTPDLEEKVASKLAKIGKYVEQRGEREIHLTHQLERHVHRVEIVMNVYDHGLVGEGTDADLTTAVHDALEKLEKQVLKLRTRWRDTKRDAKGVRSSKEDWENNGGSESTESAETAKRASSNGSRPKIFHVNYDEDRKPMTLDEALLEIEGGANYIVYRDSEKSCLSVLIRRPDGHLDLIES